ncbi:MAG TPA: glycosyltransferase [Burkholderiaceae bacterium]|nr:glycosyltransferase [Burkholderiaceae bacterium]
MSTPSRPVVSVGLPVYNGERFLRSAMDSILGQSLRDIELIVSDNASTDSTAEICNEYARRDQRVRYLRQPENIGAPRNWNLVAREARGSYLKWASANDYCDPSMLESCVAALEAEPQAVVCYGRTVLVDEATSAHRSFDGDLALLDDSPSARLTDLLKRLSLNNAMSGVVRVSALRGSRLIRMYPGGDIVLVAELALAGKFLLLPQPLLYRRIGQTTSSMALPEDQLARFLDPHGWRSRYAHWVGGDFDIMLAALRARIPLADKGRALALLVRQLYWDLRKARYAAGQATVRGS